jgi:hypothetical protein
VYTTVRGADGCRRLELVAGVSLRSPRNRPSPVGARGERWFGYGTVSSAEAYLAKYEELIGAILDCPTIAGFCYTQLTDTEQETNGLLAADRTPKLDPAAVAAITKRPSRAVPGEVLANIQSAAQVTTFQGADG